MEENPSENHKSPRQMFMQQTVFPILPFIIHLLSFGLHILLKNPFFYFNQSFVHQLINPVRALSFFLCMIAWIFSGVFGFFTVQEYASIGDSKLALGVCDCSPRHSLTFLGVVLAIPIRSWVTNPRDAVPG